MKKKVKVVKVLKPEEMTDTVQKLSKRSIQVKDEPDVTKENLITKMDNNMRTEVPATEFLGQYITLGGMINGLKDKFGDELTLDHLVPLSTNLNPLNKVVPLPLTTPYNDIYKESTELIKSDNKLLHQMFIKTLQVNQTCKKDDPKVALYNQMFKEHYQQINMNNQSIIYLRCKDLAYQFGQSFIACAENVLHSVYTLFLEEYIPDSADFCKNEKVLNKSCFEIVCIFCDTFTSLLESSLNNLNNSFSVASGQTRCDENEEEIADLLDAYYSRSIIPHAANIGIMKLYNLIEDNIIEFINNSIALSSYKGVDVERLFEDMICALYPLFDSTRTNILKTMHLIRNEYMTISFTQDSDPIYNYANNDTFQKIIESDFSMNNKLDKLED